MALSAVLALSACDTGDAEGACAAELAEGSGVRVLIGSEVIGERVRAGRVAACEGAAGAAFVAITDARQRMPSALRPAVDVHLDPLTGHEPGPIGAEAHLASASLLVAGRTAGELDVSIWIHELTHVAAAGPRPRDAIAARLVEAVDEAVADYAAAAVLGRTTIGPVEGAGRRDLEGAEALRPDAFRALALPGHGWEPHRFGLPLAAALHRREPTPGPLLTDLVDALGGDTPWPDAPGAGTALRALVERTPHRSRRILEEALSEWLPRELRP